MLDYYGSILKSEKEIDRELVDRFKKYNKNHILRITNSLRSEEILPLQNSVSGWMVFTGNYIVLEIRKTINKETEIAKRKLAFVKFYESLSPTDYDIPELICNHITQLE